MSVSPAETGVEVVVDGLGLKTQIEPAATRALCYIDIAEQRVGGRGEVQLAIGIDRAVIGKGRQMTVEIEGVVVVVDPHVNDSCLEDAQIHFQQALEPVGLKYLQPDKEVVMDIV